MNESLPDKKIMCSAFLRKDSNFEGIFYVAVKTTGIFCRPTCTARKPKQKNIDFFYSTREALLHGYRPCKICKPLADKGDMPIWLKALLDEIDNNPDLRLRDGDLKKRGIDPNRIRRWFKKNHGLTFRTFLRTLRIGNAFKRIKSGEKVIDAAFESGYESLSGFAASFKKITGFSPSESREHQFIVITRVPTPIGLMLAGATEKGICLLDFADRRALRTELNNLKKLLKAEIMTGSNKHLEELNKQLKEYFNGQRREFSVPLVLPGTSFQQNAWSCLQAIPYGTTRSYKEQAQMIGRPNAIRAVARANSENRISIIVPCHRVIGEDGKLTGYGGGLWRKQYLLNLEANKGIVELGS